MRKEEEIQAQEQTEARVETRLILVLAPQPPLEAGQMPYYSNHPLPERAKRVRRDRLKSSDEEYQTRGIVYTIEPYLFTGNFCPRYFQK